MGLIKSILANFKGHKLRTIATLLWIIIGITSVVIVNSIGNGFEKEISKSFDKINTRKTNIYFYSDDYSGSGNGGDSMSIFFKPFTNQDIETLSFIEGVEKIAPANQDFNSMGSVNSSEIFFDKKSAPIDYCPFKNKDLVKGCDVNFGRGFSPDDEDRKVIILTTDTATQLFDNPEKAIGNGVSLDNIVYEIIGVADLPMPGNDNEESTQMYEDPGFFVSFIPEKAFNASSIQDMYSTEISGLSLTVAKGYEVSDVSTNIVNKLTELHPGIAGYYEAENQSDSIAEIESAKSNISNFVMAITVISMFVGGIGVMNIMYISVMERKREIGIRRAVGAKPKNILMQFLSEAIFITTCGGILGIVVGIIATNYISTRLPFEAVFSFKSLVYALVTTILTGVIFGMIPAIKASKVHPIEAIYG